MTPSPDLRARRLSAASEELALEALHTAGCTDGLPVVIPTPERVQRMIVSGGVDADIILGAVGPGRGEATVEKVAVNAVMAGCGPEHFPVVIAAVRAISDPRFDLDVVQSTTHCIGPTLMVNGPAREICGPIAGTFGALGPGHRANASIGRALRLVMINIGGGRPGTSDMALLGQPGKFSSCLAENEEESPWPPLHTTFGFRAEQSTVTALATEAPASVMASLDVDDPGAAEKLLTVLAASVANVGSNNAYLSRAAVALLINPEHAQVLARRGYDRPAIQEFIFQHARQPRALMETLSPALVRTLAGDSLPAVSDPDKVLVLCAGGGGIYSAVLHSWGGGDHGNIPVTQEIEIAQSCEIPNLPPAAGSH